METSTFLRPHIEFAHKAWRKFLCPGDCALDATCGNGHDTKYLTEILFPHSDSHIMAIDIQEAAIAKSQENLRAIPNFEKISWRCQSHQVLPPLPKAPKLIVYNLGYLPGGDKALTTQVESTLKSLEHAKNILHPDGLISITCYPGHDEGAREENAIFEWARAEKHHIKIWNREKRAPSNVLITLKESLLADF